ncbi:hypothetical protein [Tardiphaga sp. OK246]|uniref:hypothetical protein n=1 Tax=Tardiphaga sp. OK246 TaxID=1855307 RepID=UPI001595ACE5|nr:hypothetical protein [Tardiphaga sp. OK246]
MAGESNPEPPKDHDELVDGLMALIPIARLVGNPMTVKLLEMALLNEIGGASDPK